MKPHLKAYRSMLYHGRVRWACFTDRFSLNGAYGDTPAKAYENLMKMLDVRAQASQA